MSTNELPTHAQHIALHRWAGQESATSSLCTEFRRQRERRARHPRKDLEDEQSLVTHIGEPKRMIPPTVAAPQTARMGVHRETTPGVRPPRASRGLLSAGW